MMNDIVERLGLAFLTAPWLPEFLVAIIATVALNYAVARLLRRWVERAKTTANTWDDVLCNAALAPAPALVWVIGVAFAADAIGVHVEQPVFRHVSALREVCVTLCLAWFSFRLTRLTAERHINVNEGAGKDFDRTTVDALSKLAYLVVALTTALLVMQSFGFSVSGLLAAGGIGGFAIGFAAKDLLANFFGGLTIYLDRPFSVGDWIRSPDKQIEGKVEAISWRHTRIRAFNKNPIYVPNALFTTIVLENPARMSHRRIKEIIGIRYEDIGKMEAICNDVRKMLREHPEIDSTQTLIVNFDKFADSSINFFIYTFTKTTQWVRYHEVKEDVLLQIAAIIAGHGAEIAFPTHTVHMAGESPL